MESEQDQAGFNSQRNRYFMFLHIVMYVYKLLCMYVLIVYLCCYVNKCVMCVHFVM
jgi:hypothetical protein